VKQAIVRAMGRDIEKHMLGDFVQSGEARMGCWVGFGCQGQDMNMGIGGMDGQGTGFMMTVWMIEAVGICQLACATDVGIRVRYIPACDE